MKTEAEVQALKACWQQDPCWNIEETEGFEDYKEELLAFREKCEVEWVKTRVYKETRSTKTNVDRAVELIEFANNSNEVWDDSHRIQMAQVHAMLALVAELKRMNDRLEGAW